MYLVIRADASSRIGTGHLMRCLALAQRWQDTGGAVLFIGVDLPLALETRLQTEAIEVNSLSTEAGSQEDAIATADIARAYGAEWVVVDGYQFGALYQQRLKDQGVSILFLDDYGHGGSYEADLVLNQNLGATADWYTRRSPQTRLLLGTQYTLLRREFGPWQTWTRSIPPVAQRVLITLGGSDPDNITAQVLTALCDVPLPLHMDVVIGGSNPHYDDLVRLTKQLPYPFSLHRNVQNMPALMAAADIAISAAGSTCWELAYMQLPTLALILAENQVLVAENLGKLGSIVNLGWYNQRSANTMASAVEELRLNLEERSRLAGIGRSLVDGQGTMRVLQAMRQLTDEGN